MTAGFSFKLPTTSAQLASDVPVQLRNSTVIPSGSGGTLGCGSFGLPA